MRRLLNAIGLMVILPFYCIWVIVRSLFRKTQTPKTRDITMDDLELLDTIDDD